VASKATQFGFADGFVVGNAVSKGMNIRAVAGLYRRNPTAVVVLADSDIKTPKDLEGKTIAIAAGSTQFQQWPAFVKGCGLDASRQSARADHGAGSCHRRLRLGSSPKRGNSRQHQGANLLVCRLRRHRGQQLHRGS
jgi:hypothetical protein